jgi:hypothetical protein
MCGSGAGWVVAGGIRNGIAKDVTVEIAPKPAIQPAITRIE